MHAIPGYIAISAFTVMGIGFSVTIFRIITKEDDLWGNPSINPFLFYSGKISLFLCIGLSLLKAIFPTFGCVDVPMWMSWTGACSLCVSTGVLLLSFYGLGSALRYGLPENDTQLKTSGLYRFSRNPMYLGVFMVILSCLIFFPNVLNIIIGLYCISMHYLMTLGEERFLTERFGSEWEEYKNKVRRFL